MRRGLGLATGLLLACQASAETSYPAVWVNPGFYSLHFDRSKDLRENNIGLGAEVVLAPEHALTAGTFTNSNDARSRYAGYVWRPLGWEVAGLDLRAGLVVAALDGYPGYDDGGWFLAPLPVLAIEGRRFGLNVILVPHLDNRIDGAIAFQLKLRVW